MQVISTILSVVIIAILCYIIFVNSRAIIQKIKAKKSIDNKNNNKGGA